MEKIISYLKRNIKLAFKTVTFHFKEYLCFYIAVLIIQTLFGIILMSAANNLKTETKEIGDSYSYHISITGLNRQQRDYMLKLDDPDYDPNDYKGQTTPRIPNGKNKALSSVVMEDSRGSGDSRVYDLYYMFEDESGSSMKTLYKRFQNLYLRDLWSLNGENNSFSVNLSPLYTIEERLSTIRIDCAVWLVLLALVSIVVLILLYNIRINHFKFTYGIYMSYGADSKTLFGTCFWEVMVIAWLTLVPSAIVATIIDFLFFKLDGYDYFFTPYLMLFGFVFMIPVVLTAVYVPVKATAVKPPLKLLLAEDNSNLVTSPRISVQMLGKKFPSAYERLSFARFKKYNIQLILSSVLFAALFVWVSFYCSIYDYNTSTNVPEFKVHFNQNRVESEKIYYVKGEEVPEFEQVRRRLYNDQIYATVRQKDSIGATFESFYNPNNYTYTYDSLTGVRTFIDKQGNDVSAQYEQARLKAVKNDATEEDIFLFESYFNPENYAYDRTSSGVVDKVYEIVEDKRITVTYEGPTYTDDLRDDLLTISGITDVFKVSSTSAFDLSSFVMFQPDDVRVNSGFIVHPTEEKYTDVTINVDYRAADDEVLSYLTNNFKIDGELSDVVDYENRVVISDSVNNRSVLKLSVGDIIKVAKFVEFTREPTAQDGLVGDKYLAYLLEYGVFEYEEYRVCAIIRDMASDDNMVMYFSDSEYEEVTGSPATYKEIDIFVDQGMSEEAIRYLDSDVRNWLSKLDYTSYEWLNNLTQTKSEMAMRKLPTFYTIAVMLLIISPLFWFFSQLMFYKKREKELDLLRGMGAIESEIKKLFVFDGILMAVVSTLITLVLSAGGVYLMYRLAQGILTMSASGANVKYYFEAPWITGAIALVATALCGFLSSYLPYALNKKKDVIGSDEFGE